MPKRRAGVAEIVGTLLILVVTVSIGAILLSVATGAISINTLDQQNQATLQIQRLQERVTTFDVWFTTVSGNSYMQVHLYNYGKVDVHLVTLYSNLTGTEAPLSTFTATYPNGVYIYPGFQVALQIPFNYVKGTAYLIILASDSGSTFTSLWSD